MQIPRNKTSKTLVLYELNAKVQQLLVKLLL